MQINIFYFTVKVEEWKQNVKIKKEKGTEKMEKKGRQERSLEAEKDWKTGKDERKML